MRLKVNLLTSLAAGAIVAAGCFSASAQSVAIPAFELSRRASAWDNLPSPILSEKAIIPASDTPAAAIIYRTRMAESFPDSTKWIFKGLQDYARIFIDGEPSGTISRRDGRDDFLMPPLGAGATVEIVVDACGKKNSGFPADQLTGIADGIGRVTIAGDTVGITDWRIIPIPDNYSFFASRPWSDDALPEGPGFFIGNFNLETPASTFLDLSKWGKGIVYINGRRAGDFWSIGPTQTVEVAADMLRAGSNEIIVFDAICPDRATLKGLTRPIENRMQRPGDPKRSDAHVDLNSEMIVAEGVLNQEGWKDVEFSFPVNARHIAFEIIDADGDSDPTQIFEVKLIGPGINSVSKEGWMISDVSSEAPGKEGEKAFDGDKATCWQPSATESRNHSFAIDMGSRYSLTGVAILSGKNSGKRYRIYAM